MDEAQPVTDPQRDSRMKYSVDWFICDTEGRHRNKRESTEQLWNRLLKNIAPAPKRICEIGLCEGRSFFWLMQNFQPEVMVGVDPWRPDRRWHAEMFATWKQNFLDNFATFTGAPLKLMANGNYRLDMPGCEYHVAPKPSEDYLRAEVDWDFPGRFFDLIYVDGDHSAFGASLDMHLSWRKLKVGGYLVIDDYDRRWHNARPAVLEAVRAFWTLIEWQSEKVLECKRQVWIRKLRD